MAADGKKSGHKLPTTAVFAYLYTLERQRKVRGEQISKLVSDIFIPNRLLSYSKITRTTTIWKTEV